jgi:hypothetical protein
MPEVSIVKVDEDGFLSVNVASTPFSGQDLYKAVTQKLHYNNFKLKKTSPGGYKPIESASVTSNLSDVEYTILAGTKETKQLLDAAFARVAELPAAGSTRYVDFGAAAPPASLPVRFSFVFFDDAAHAVMPAETTKEFHAPRMTGTELSTIITQAVGDQRSRLAICRIATARGESVYPSSVIENKGSTYLVFVGDRSARTGSAGGRVRKSARSRRARSKARK